MFRFSLRWLLAIVSLFCLGLAALRNPTEPMMLAVAAVLVSSTAVGIVFAAARRSAFGAAYAGGIFATALLTSQTFAVGTIPSDRLVQMAAVHFLGPLEKAGRMPMATHYAAYIPGTFRDTNVLIDYVRLWRFRGMARGILAIVVGVLAGVAAARLSRRNGELATPVLNREQSNHLAGRWLIGLSITLALGAVELWAGSELSLTLTLFAVLGILFVAAVQAMAFGRSAPISLGMALLGGGYLVLSIMPLSDDHYGVRMPTEVVTSAGLAEALDLPVELLKWEALRNSQLAQLSPGSPGWRYVMNVHRIALLLWSLVIGLVGGLAVAVVQERAQRAS